MSDTITLSIDGKDLPVNKDAIKLSVYIRNLIENVAGKENESDDEDTHDSENIVIKIDTIDYNIMKKVAEWCEHYFSIHGQESIESGSVSGNKWSEDILKEHRAKAYDTPLDNWDREFLNGTIEDLSKIIAASDFLNIQPLLSSCCKVVAQYFKGKSPHEVIEAFAKASSTSEN
ncbi:hypothetical protein CANINC_000274 [Pichia inconspicua]|uniref:E3 ubiquitin ligase complex SCF subunit n=1 Tax=Pichia inconspicua TaxID=52247 RepID=A0A4T0X836_9ASCO|nr:hypothetical protein CANINC_000274 [[Candida] inconspicua]